MNKSILFILLFVLVLPGGLLAGLPDTCRVYDARTKEPLPFATVKFATAGQGVVAEPDGAFVVPAGTGGWIEVSFTGYKPQKITLPLQSHDIYLQHADNALQEVTIKPPYEKMRRILNSAIANKKANNPDKYDWYRCHVYYKMIVDADRTPLKKDSVTDKKKTSSGRDKERKQAAADSLKQTQLNDFFAVQHLLMSETYSIRTWQQPQRLQEDVVASRFSGFKKSMFTGLVTDVLPFHAYSDYINLNGKDYHNPVSNGYWQYYKFNLEDELVQGRDTTWVLSFRPKGHNANELKGTVYINSNGYAISQIIARAKDTMLKMDVRIEQQYEQLPVTATENRWFPKHLNYVIDWTQQTSRSQITFHLKGTSRIDSVTWNEDPGFNFDKAHTVRLRTKADELSDSTWQLVRPTPLDTKETRTYKVIDSLGDKLHFDRLAAYLSKLPEGKLPLGILDIDLTRLIAFNDHESVRAGLGLQTNEHLIKWLSIGGWAGYGFGDKQWKYGAFAELYADKYREFVFKVSYTDDINDPGRVHINPELDKNFLNAYLLQRVDETKTIAASVKKKIGYWNVELAGRQQQIMPEYAYALLYDGSSHTTFTANEASLSFRYAYAERTAPFFNSYYSLGSKYPVWYGKITTGTLSSGNDLKIPYTQAVTAAVWHKHINRIGFEHVLIEGGISCSNGTLPLSKLFAGNGYNYDSKARESLYTFGGLLSMLPYQYYTDRFVSVIYRHDFDWKLYKFQVPDTKFSSAPNICLQYNMLYGTLADRAAQQLVSFSVPDNAYHEGGLLINNLVRVRYGNLYYLTLNAGYFYHFTNTFDAANNGRVVIGAGIEL